MSATRWIPLLLLALPGMAIAQWNGDPAQAGAETYCEMRNQGRSSADAEQKAIQIMAEVLLIRAGPVGAGLQLNSPALLERWRYLADSLCPESELPLPDTDPDRIEWMNRSLHQPPATAKAMTF
jgi:hypothetical protein